jgi:hypothetical protein
MRRLRDQGLALGPMAAVPRCDAAAAGTSSSAFYDEVVRPDDVIVLVKPIDAIGRHGSPMGAPPGALRSRKVLFRALECTPDDGLAVMSILAAPDRSDGDHEAGTGPPAGGLPTGRTGPGDCGQYALGLLPNSTTSRGCECTR